jgi:uncharacterized protein YidB (DUF937 family)
VNVSTIPSTAANGVSATAGATPAHRGHRISDATMDAVAAKLGMSTDDLKSSLAKGQSMTDLAQKAGVSKDDLVSTIAATLSSQGVNGQTVDPTQLATRIADHARPTGGHGGHQAASGATGGAGSAVGQGIDALSSALGISSDDLVQRLTDGTGIADLLDGNSGVASQLSAAQNKGALVDGWA